MGAISDLLQNIALPRMAKVRQTFERPRVDDYIKALRMEFEKPAIGERIKPGMRIAITAGSRGIKNIAAVTKEAADFCRERGASPFVFSAMGGHGGACEAGQREILTTYGFTEADMGCPVDTSMDVVAVGHLASGDPVFLDRAASEADGIIVINQVQAHTTFRGEYESGLIKMMGAGMGNQQGALALHKGGLDKIGASVREYGLAVHRAGKILFGLAIVQNAYGETAAIEALDYEAIPREEPRLLQWAKSLMPRFHFESADVLVVDEIGKNINGDGMDPNITGRYVSPKLSGGLNPTRLAALDIAKASNGNGNGIGLADVTTMRAFNKFDREKSYPNVLTTTALAKCRMPLVFESDHDAVRAAVMSCAGLTPSKARVIRVKNTLAMDSLLISEALLPEAAAHEHVEIMGEPEAWPFDGAGNLF